MSTLHHMACWPAIRSEVKLDKLTFPEKGERSCWKIVKSEARFIYTFYEVSIQSMINTALDGLRKKLPSFNGTVFFQLTLKNAFDAGNHPLITLYQSSVEKIANSDLARKLETCNGLNASEQKAAYNKMLTYVYGHLSDFRSTVRSDHIKSDVQANEWTKTAHNNIVQMRTICGAQVVDQKWVPTSEDKKFLGLNENDTYPAFDQLDCTAYTFLNLREEKAIPWIKNQLRSKNPQANPHADEHQFYHGDVFGLLDSWGYRIVKDPDEGDIIIYFNNVNDPKPKHTGKMLENGKVQSKMGRDETAITVHDIKSVPGQFGLHFMFVRKSKNL